MRRLREGGRIRRGERPWPAAHGRVCRSARPSPRVRSVPVHGRRGVRSSGRGRARRRDGLALPHPTSHGRALASFLCTAAAAVRGGGRAGGSAGANAHGPPPMAAFAAARAHGRAFAALLCTIAAGVCSSGRGRARRRDGLALPHPTSHGRAFASFLCTIAAGVRRLREGGRIRRGERPWPAAHGRAFAAFLCTVAAGVRGGGTGWRFPTPHPPAARSQRSCARPPRRAQFRPRPFAAEGRAGASSPHIPWPRVRVVSVHDRRRRAAAAGRAGASSPHIPRPRVRSVPVHGRRGVRSSGRGRSQRSNSYRAQGGFAPTAAVRRRRAPLRSRSAPRAGRGPRGRSGRRPRSAGRWGGAGRASR